MRPTKFIALFAMLFLMVTATIVNAGTVDIAEIYGLDSKTDGAGQQKRGTKKVVPEAEKTEDSEQDKDDDKLTIILAPTTAQPSTGNKSGGVSSAALTTTVVRKPKPAPVLSSTQIFNFKSVTDGVFADLTTTAGCSFTRILLNASNQTIKNDGGGRPLLQPFVAASIIERDLCNNSLDTISHGFGMVAPNTLTVSNNLSSAKISSVTITVFTEFTNVQRDLVITDLVWTENGQRTKENFNDTFVFGSTTIRFHTNGKFQPALATGWFSLGTPYSQPISGGGSDLIYKIHNGTLARETN